MAKFQLSRPGTWDYATMGFTAVDGAILDGALSTPPVTIPPDAFWSVYGGASAETGITRHGVSTYQSPVTEPADGAALVYNATSNTYEPTDLALTATYAPLASPLLGAPQFPPPILPSNPAAVDTVTAAPDEATLEFKVANGTNVTLTTMLQVDRDKFFSGGGLPFVAPWPGNSVDVMKPGTQQTDIGTSSWCFSVVTNATWLLVRGNFVFGSTSFLSRMIRVNGQQISARTVGQSAAMVAGAFGGILIKFRDASTKSVEVFSSGQIRSYVTNTGATVAAFVPPTRKKLYVLGDSWAAGTTQADPVGSMAKVLQHSVPWDVSYNGQGSTGYVAGSANSFQCKYGDARRTLAITEYDPDVLVVFGSINDNGQSASAVGTAAAALYAAIASGSPACKLIVVGPQLADGTNPANEAAIEAAAVAAPNVIGYVDPWAEKWTTRDLVRGPTDLLHPSVLGAEFLARRLEDVVRRFTVAAGDNGW